ncbi:inorganic triphosphatase [Bordetella genomosp. 5]|uniref:CYTH and CHAD domain-containing protein n=1 Tax=Bordetella genomosp. 5 TaxID=1395608 RepID=UPI000B9E39CC|nr:CYTH and CHAD domain-containing protein [Bordetella genomosp. 5]OZI38752.1 inorganic triphosphatase [Bordetella genomosp. 5]
MSEQELKLHVPASAIAAIRRELGQRQSSRIRLRALYFDTPERELVHARIALRLRQEGRQWVQTVKMPGANAITRIELNHPRPGPVLDLSLYAGTEVGDALARIQGELGVRYETDVSRQLCKLRSRYGTVEVALDTGLLRAGALELPISEIEFELVSGRPEAIFAVGRQWQKRHGLVLDVRSKSERGDALAEMAQTLANLPDGDEAEAARKEAVSRFWAPRGARSVKLRPEQDAVQALTTIAGECLEQIVRNAAALAEVDTAGVYAAGSPEHVHQLRVGMRRLRSAWKLFEGWVAPPAATLDAGIREYFGAFGASRDQDVLADTVVPLLERAGMPPIPAEPVARGADAHALAASPAFQAWLLELFEWSMNIAPPPAAESEASQPAAADGAARSASVPADDEHGASERIVPTIIGLNAGSTEAEAPAAPALSRLLAKRLRRWHKSVAKDGQRFSELDLESRHELRKRGKRLRYSLSFAESLLPATRLRTYRKQLAHVQELLGEINDLAVAAEHYRTQTDAHPQAWFALGWIAARLETLVAQAQPSFDALAHAKPFWK